MGAFTVNITIRDAKGKYATTEFNFPASYDFQDITLFAAQAAGRINNLIRGVITGVSVSQVISDFTGITLRTDPEPEADVEEGAKFQFKTAGGFYTSMRLPTFDEDLIIDGTKNVDLTNAAVDTFVDSMVTGAPVVDLGGVLSPSDKHDNDILSLEFAKEEFQSSRSG